MDIKIKEIDIHNFRSISKMTIKLNDNNFYSICGANNVGKTNFLRALDLFFSTGTEKFEPNIDIPYHIAYGSRGQGYKSEISITFDDGTYLYKIKKIFSANKENGRTLNILGTKKTKGKSKGTLTLTEKDCNEFIENHFQLFYIAASNVNLPHLISMIVKNEILPIGLKRKNEAQNKSMKALKEFIDATQIAVSKIESEITNNMKAFVNDIEGIDTSLWNMKILFPEFNDLREAISGMIDFTLYDTNSNSLETKGSGIQRVVLLSLIRYISEKTAKKIIWCIDEPEAFLQPSLQKQIKEELFSMINDNYMFITTHSHFFVDIKQPERTLLFRVSSELKDYKRANGKKYYKNNTEYVNKEGFAKIEAIRKHLGLENNDSWEIMPYNIVVEGEEDKKYLLSLSQKFNIDMPNIIAIGGASKVQGVLGYINLFCNDLSYKPKVLCILDHDSAGKSEYDSLNTLIKKNVYKNFDVNIKYIIRADNITDKLCEYEIEDFIYPDVFYMSVNKLLRLKKYKILSSKYINLRQQPAYERMHILEFITQICKIVNPDKVNLDFNSMELKKYICKLYCEYLSEIDIKEAHEKYPAVKNYLLEISNEFNV